MYCFSSTHILGFLAPVEGLVFPLVSSCWCLMALWCQTTLHFLSLVICKLVDFESLSYIVLYAVSVKLEKLYAAVRYVFSLNNTFYGFCTWYLSISTGILIWQNETYLILIGCSFGLVSSYCVEWSTECSATSWQDFRSMHRDHKSCEQCVSSHCYQISARVLWQWIQNRFLVNLF